MHITEYIIIYQVVLDSNLNFVASPALHHLTESRVIAKSRRDNRHKIECTSCTCYINV